MNRKVYSRLSRCGTARGQDLWYNWGGPDKVGDNKSFQFI